MIGIDDAIAAGKLILSAIEVAKQALEASSVQLKDALVEAEKMRDQLAADRKDADTALDKKFDASKDG